MTSRAPGVSAAAIRGLSLAGMLGLWAVASAFSSERLLPSPIAVTRFVLDETLHGDLLANMGMTLWRVAASYAAAMAVGVPAGVLLGRLQGADALFDGPVLVLLNAPALVLAVLCYIWLGLNETAAIVAVALNKLPNVIVIVREGARSLDRDLEEMSRAYRLTTGAWIRLVMLPQLAPYLAAASRSGLALVWKIVLVVELLGRPNGVGYAISISFQTFDLRGVLGYAAAFMAVMLAIEFILLRPIERHLRRWRLPPG